MADVLPKTTPKHFNAVVLFRRHVVAFVLYIISVLIANNYQIYCAKRSFTALSKHRLTTFFGQLRNCECSL